MLVLVSILLLQIHQLKQVVRREHIKQLTQYIMEVQVVVQVVRVDIQVLLVLLHKVVVI